MRFREFRQQYMQGLLEGQTPVFPDVPAAIQERWRARFYKAERPSELPEQFRLLNHFGLGADPEFSISYKGSLRAANEFGFHAGLAFGADNNGRLVELRPHPSRSALRVLASLLSELRWLLVMFPQAAGTTWNTGPFDELDGLGGHVHFGRKQRQLINKELDALEVLYSLLCSTGFFDQSAVKARYSHNHGGVYGQNRDSRAQKHGYEYRALPSWLDSPWHAYLALVLSKLAVCEPERFLRAAPGITPRTSLYPALIGGSAARSAVRNILASFKAVDDDALYAYIALDIWGHPVSNPILTDFKSAWGLLGPAFGDFGSAPYKVPTVLPPFIEPSDLDVQELFNYLLMGQKLPFRWPSPPKWEFQTEPNGFRALQRRTNTLQAPGLGELVWDLLQPVDKELVLNIGFSRDEQVKERGTVYYAKDLEQLCVISALRKQFPQFYWSRYRGDGRQLVFSKRAFERPKDLRAILSRFPVVQYRDVSTWKWVAPQAQKPAAKRCHVLFE